MPIDKQNRDEIALKDIIIKVRKLIFYIVSKWVIILTCSFTVGALGFVYTMTKKPTYIAITTFVLEEEKGGGGLGSLAGLASLAGVDISTDGGGIFHGDNILELYQSRTMIEKTLLTEIVFNGRKELLVDRYIDINHMRDKWGALVNFREVKHTRLQDSVLGIIVDEIRKQCLKVAKPDKKLSIIRAEVRSHDEFFAKVFNDQIVRNVNDFYIQTKTHKSLQNVTILQQKTDSVRAVMNGDIFRAAAVVDATPNLNYTRQIQRLGPVQKSQFSAEANKGILGELVKNLELSKISLRKETPLIQIIDFPILPLEKNNTSPLFVGILLSILTGMLIITFFIIVAKLKKIGGR